jgi:hypothetical protein
MKFKVERNQLHAIETIEAQTDAMKSINLMSRFSTTDEGDPIPEEEAKNILLRVMNLEELDAAMDDFMKAITPKANGRS